MARRMRAGPSGHAMVHFQPFGPAGGEMSGAQSRGVLAFVEPGVERLGPAGRVRASFAQGGPFCPNSWCWAGGCFCAPVRLPRVWRAGCPGCGAQASCVQQRMRASSFLCRAVLRAHFRCAARRLRCAGGSCAGTGGHMGVDTPARPGGREEVERCVFRKNTPPSGAAALPRPLLFCDALFCACLHCGHSFTPAEQMPNFARKILHAFADVALPGQRPRHMMMLRYVLS